MSIDNVVEMWSRSSGSIETPDFGKSYRANFERAFSVVHSADATQIEIVESVNIALGDSFPGAPTVFCTKVGPHQRTGLIHSIVPVSYAGEIASGDPADSAVNKLPEITWSNSKTTEPIDTDGYGFPLTNVNGDLMQGFSKDVSDFTLTVKRNFLSINIYAINEYLDSVNSDTFAGWPPGTAALDTFQAQIENPGLPTEYAVVSAKIDFRVPYLTTAERAWWLRYRNEGLNERIGTSIAFTGGGGSGAAGYAVTNSSNVITAIVVTNRGRGYTSAPTVSITSTTGGASGAATAVLNSRGEVVSVTVTNGGTGYKSRLVRALDDNKQPVSQPILLNAQGAREKNGFNAVWIERPKKTYIKSYNALGLL